MFYREGFKETRVSSILHQIDLGMKHQTSNFGLSLMMVRKVVCTLGRGLAILIQVNENPMN